ncbi:MAG: zinc metallopeptidase [Acidobacteriota bacterium]|nr:zinc metallopeptidase [Acidobacteriota bacterium]MDH3522059.1 zinc metallopeptidase [Acidobacteriota bacterium]
MRWRGQSGSANVEDRRGGRGGMLGGRIPGGRPLGVGCGGIILVAVLALVFGADPQQLFEVLEQTQATTRQQPMPAPRQGGEAGDELGQFASVVLADTEQTWGGIFQRSGTRYREPVMVLFSDAVRSACGFNSAATGPFYCPADGKLYLDLGFFDQLERRFGAPGDFAQAYVIAHEVGHHVQNLWGINEQVERARRQVSRAQGNELSVRMELQADCLAGVWAHHAHADRRLLEPGDVEEGLRAAAAIGDDNIQRSSGMRVQPESWTHGSSQQRVSWLRRGMETGDPDACDTFG